MISHDTQLLLAELRQKARDNTTTPEELRQALVLLRGDRTRAQATSSKAKGAKAAKAATKDIDSDGLLDELEGL
jgi:hypothetical protein